MQTGQLTTIWKNSYAILRDPIAARKKVRIIKNRLKWRYGLTLPNSIMALDWKVGNGLDHLVCELGRKSPVLILHREPNCARIGLPVDKAMMFLGCLYRSHEQLSFYSGGRELRSSLFRFRTSILKYGIVKILFCDESGILNSLHIDLYEPRGEGVWVSYNTQNSIARALYSFEFESPGLRSLNEVASDNSPAARIAAVPVDLVFTWVNHSDLNWKKMFIDHTPSGPELTDGRSLSRFHNNDELRYALRAVARYLPWAQKIYIVSNCEAPSWLNLAHPQVVWVDHETILPRQAIPTFNSHAIETALHKIPNLSEHFIYFNDDMFPCRPLEKSWFFNANGTSRAHVEKYGMVTGATTVRDPEYLNAARNGAKLIEATYNFWPTQLHSHAPYSLRRSVLETIESQFPEEVGRTRFARFRSPNDISMVSFLYHHFAWGARLCTFEEADVVMAKNTDLRWRSDLARALNDGCDILCINEGGQHKIDRAWQRAVKSSLSKRFPWCAPWEFSNK